jgi:Leucine-rich repeat (LRR) protein
MHLMASRNSLLSLPEHLGDLTNLERLDVTTNYLESLPSSLERCTKIEELHLSDNCLKNVDLSQLTLMLPKLRYLKFDPQHKGRQKVQLEDLEATSHLASLC